MGAILRRSITAVIAMSSLLIVPMKASADVVSAYDGNSVFEKRRKPRAPGGSGCDDPRDIIEHPECRP